MIAVSPDIFQMQRFGGVSRCIYEISRRTASARDVTIYGGATANEYILEGLEGGSFPGRIVGRRVRSNPGRIRGGLKAELEFAYWLRKHTPNVVHRSYYAPVDLISRKTPVVETLHDLMWERLSGGSGIAARANSVIKRRALQRADVIVCVSHNTLSDLETIWPRLAEKAVVIHHGVGRLSTCPIEPAASRPFFLYVGSREARKNFPILLTALADNPRLAQFDLLCVGGGALTETERELINASGLVDRVWHNDLDDDHLVGHFQKAVALLYPSRYEGFGMPLLEAMIHGCPVISSNVTSLPEVCGDAALMCSPDEVENWRVAMERVATDTEIRRSLVQSGHERAAAFSWDEAARRYVEVYDRLGS